MPRYLNPKSDFIFKKIFGEHPQILKSFLNAVLPLPSGCEIQSLEYLPTENVPDIPGFKYTIVDVRCLDNYNRHFIVEMQLQWSRHFMQRRLFNTASAYVKQLESAENYNHLSPVYGLAVIDDIFSKKEEWYHHYRMTHVNDHDKTLDDIQLVFIELPKLTPTTWTEKKLTVLWLRFLAEINEKVEEIDCAFFEDENIRTALKLIEKGAYTAAQLRTYEANWDAVRTEKTLISDSYEKGIEKGVEQGIEMIARNMIDKDMNVAVVAELTGLSVKKVETIKNSAL